MSEGKWWTVRLRCTAKFPESMGEPVADWIEERRVFADTPEDAVAKAAGWSEADVVQGATVDEEAADGSQ